MLLRPVACQDNTNNKKPDLSQLSKNPAATKLFSDIVSKSFSNYTTVFKNDIKKQFGFCIVDADADWNDAFNFTGKTEFLTNCAKKRGDVTKHLCTSAEIKFYFSSFFEHGSKKTNYLKPNKNCNLTSWTSGCEPGWACSVAKDNKADLKNTKEMPDRMVDCAPCCEACPLGAYCPLAKLNKTTGVCDPYRYQLPPGKMNHSCGGADIWADILSSREVFCSAGSYCPTTIQKNPCSSGHFCRTGSTAQTNCFKLASCEPKSENQNITAYGIILFAGLSFLAVIIYNCSDQVLATRERRQAKSREKAVQSVRETAQARAKWTTAKETAKKHAIDFQTQLSRTFSRRKPEQMKPPVSGSSAASKGKKKEKSNLTKMLHEIEDNPDGTDGFNLEIGDKHIKKNQPKGKQLHTQSQIFRYAYGQIEKEKQMQDQNKNLTFSGVISMANDDTEVIKRPTIEVAFKDLTLTLKSKNKHLLRCVTGKLSPGRVSAVMGPSGAGKTTFLSALLGKASGCSVTGSVLINGKNESIRSYKKITGFVPQDDIVHGNLTVEENLWFSARCRFRSPCVNEDMARKSKLLAASLAKPEKVLVVERVIEALGLQAVRDSLVGTVEKRGISGGQRKRVNVGMEMVMEPSLLILDEPTSGLDSSSSQLLLRALRREALEGVNICMVLHQPSYTLFRMFDDLILLAKGGLTVYHGSAKKVEEYFSNTLGINVPERVNPPDYFIDILEGIIKPNSSAGVTVKQLPVRWMLHNGYAVPMDMLKLVEGMPGTGGDSNHGRGSVEDPSFAGDFWQDMRAQVEEKKDNLQYNFFSKRDLSQRTTPGILHQYKYFLGRVGKQRLREARTQAVDYLILLLAGICLGTLAKVSDETFGSAGYTYTVIAVSLLCKIAALRSFALDKLHYWRESSSGMSSLAYFMAKDTVDHFNTLTKPLVYLSMFYFFNNPRSSVSDNYIVLVCLVYCVTGIAYGLAIAFEPSPAQLWSVLLPVVLTLVATHESNNKIVDKISDLCYTKWALEAFVVSNAKRYSGVWLITRCGSLMSRGYNIKHYARCLIFLMLTGLASRMVAFFCLITFNKK
ncbi:hypothetical protein ACFE04_012770 [Oxalis oulophora]